MKGRDRGKWVVFKRVKCQARGPLSYSDGGTWTDSLAEGILDRVEIEPFLEHQEGIKGYGPGDLGESGCICKGKIGWSRV